MLTKDLNVLRLILISEEYNKKSSYTLRLLHDDSSLKLDTQIVKIWQGGCYVFLSFWNIQEKMKSKS